MKTLKFLYLAVALAGGAALGADSQPAAVTINPAQLYYQAFLVAPIAVSNEEMDYTYSKAGLSQPLPERFADLVASYDPQFNLVRQAARSTVACDWGLDMSQGPAAPLPHLARAKAVSQAARLRVRWHLEHGRQAEACEELLATLVLARNLPADGLLISTLVEMAMEAILCNSVAQNYGLFSADSLERLAKGFESPPARHTVAQCMATEKALFHDYAINKIRELQKQHAGNDAKVMEEVGKLFGFETDRTGNDLWTRLKQASDGTSEGVIALLQEREKYGPKLMAVLTLPYAEYRGRLQDLETETGTSPNPLVSQTLTSIARARSRELRILATLGMVRAAIEYRVRGEPGFQSVTDPCGSGPFAFRRFVFEGVDRGFELKSVYDVDGNKGLLIFVEKPGTPFRIDGPKAGTAIESSPEAEAFKERYGIKPGK